MKRLLLLLSYFTWQTICIAQSIENPAFDRCDIPAFHITKVKITKDTTYVFCSYYVEAGSWASISKETYLRDSKTHKKFPILRSSGLPFSPKTRDFDQNESCELLFCFPSIAGTEQFDFIENEGERAFNIYNVNLKRSYKVSYSDMELKHISEMLSDYDSFNESDNTIQYKDYAKSLNNLSSYYLSKGNYAEAIRLGKVEVEIREKIFGNKHQSYIEALGNLASYYAILGDYDNAIHWRTEELKTRKSILGTENSQYIYSLEELATYYYDDKDIAEAIRIQQEVTCLKKKVLGTENVGYASSLTWLAEYNYELNNYEEAIRACTEAMEIYKKQLGKENPNYTMSLSSLALFYYDTYKYKYALQLQSEVVDILKRVVGSENTDYAASLSRLADYNFKLSNYDEAIKLGTDAMNIFKNVLGSENPDYAASLSRLADYNSQVGNYPEAIRLGIEAKKLYKTVLGTENEYYASTISNLAGYYLDIGNYDETSRLMTEAYEIYKKIFGPESLNSAISLNNFADYNSHVGNYPEAIKLVTEAMEIYKLVIGTEHPLYATSLINLANYNSNVGNYSEAIRLGTEAMEIIKRILGTKHSLYATSLHSLAINYSEVGNYLEAIRLGTEAMETYKLLFGSNHPDYARSLNSLAVYYSYLGNDSEALRLETEAIEIRKNVLGREHPLYTTSLLNLAGIYTRLNNYSEAIKLGIEAKEIIKTILGTGHPYYAQSLNHLAHFNLEQNNYHEAFNYLQEFLSLSQSYVLHNFSELSSRIQENMWVYKYAYKYNTLFPNIVNKYQTKESISELYNKTCLFAKSLLLNTNIEMRKLILESGDPIIVDKYNKLVSNISIYNKLMEKPIKERFMNADSLYRVIEQEEITLARESKAYGDYTHNLTINWKDIEKELGDDDIAIEFLDFPIINSDSTMYVALTLKKGYDCPHMVSIFERSQLNAIQENPYNTETDLSDLVWKPLGEELEGVKNVYFSPSGELHRIGIEYLPISNTENISEEYTLHRLSSTRQLAVIQDKTEGQKSILYGGINYDEKSSAFETDSDFVEGAALRSAFSRANVDSLSLRSSFEYLEGSKREADMIADDLKRHRVPYIYYGGVDGTEESFKRLDGIKPKTMHIATHGFFLTEEEAEKSKFARQEIKLKSEEIPNTKRFVEDKPMTRSGLLFSGCNRAFRHEQIPEAEEDGILTAQEISMLDLRGLDLVVLSACQTGLGDLVSGEGVFGLQRGFKKAGANTILMSLDKVNDEATMILMVEFYKNLMEGKSKHESLKDAQKHLRQIDNGKYDSPKYWASFIMLDGLN